MVVKQRMGILLAGTMLGASFLIAAPAFAQDAQTQQNQKLQNEINALQQQLQGLKDQMATQAAPAGLYNQAPPGASHMPTKAAPAWMDTVHISMAGSFIAMEGVERQRNEVAGGATDTPFSSMPFPNSPLYHENELAFSAQQSRIQMEATGNIDPTQHLKAHFEMDFLGAGVTANSRESNSYNLRVRQLFAMYENDNYHFHFKFGQQWSLVTQERVGMMEAENTPLTIDAQYVAGFNWARQPSVRFVEDWNKIAWFGFSVEAPQTAFASNSIGVVNGPQQGVAASQGITAATNAGGNTTLPPPLTGINDLSACQASGLLNSTTACSLNNYPDLVEKFALDPGWGHYEVIGLQRFFTDRVYTAVEGSGTNMTTTGWGIGGNALMPVWPKIVDLQGSVMYGAGLGRYGSSQLPDVAIGSNGSLQPLTSLQFLVGAVIHPTAPLDVYVYYGEEQLQSNAWTVGGANGGYGNPTYANTGCLFENQASGPAAFSDPISGTTCSAATNVQRVQEITVGFWYNLYKGDLGRVRFGMQYEYWNLTAFAGSTTASAVANASPPNSGINPNNQAVFFSFRYYPFN